jgi:hypothetical protein
LLFRHSVRVMVWMRWRGSMKREAWKRGLV